MAYLEIYNNYYRDEWIEDEIEYGQDGSGIDFLSNNTLRQAKYPKDYFTGSLPFPKRVTPSLCPLAILLLSSLKLLHPIQTT